MHKSIKTQTKQKLYAVKKRKCGMVVDAQILLMMRKKILFI